MLEDIKLPFIDKKVINKHEREYQIGLIDGQGVMTSIDIYPGIQVIYNNFHCFWFLQNANKQSEVHFYFFFISRK